MAQYYQIRVGNDYIEVPDWVTLDVFQNLIDIESGSNSTLKNIEQVLRLLLAKDSDIKEVNNEIKKSNKEAVEKLDKSQNETKDLKDVVDNNLKNLTGVNEKTNKNISQQVKEDKKNFSNLSYRQHLMFERLGTDLSRNFQSIYEGNIQGFGDSIQSLLGNIPFVGGILGGITGIITGAVEEYLNVINTTSDIGVSFGMQLGDLKESASDAGLGVEAFSSLLYENASTLRVLGNNATESARTFSSLSSRVLEGAERFNFFGMTNQEINELLIEELELRRKSGQSLEYLTENQDKVAKNFNELMVETSALASITGQSRREMLRERAEALSDVGISAFTERLTESQREAFQAPATMLSGLLGGDLTQNILRSATTGFGLDFYMRGLGVGGEFGQGLRELSQFVSQNYENMDPDLLQERMFEMVRGLEGTIDDELIDTLVRQKDAGNEFAATLLETIQRVRGIEGTFEEYQTAMRRERELIENQSQLQIPAQLEQTSKQIQASMLRQFEDLIPGGEGFGDILKGLEDAFDDEASFLEGVTNVFDQIEGADIFLLSNIAGTLTDIYNLLKPLKDFFENIFGSFGEKTKDYKEAGYGPRKSFLMGSSETVLDAYDWLANNTIYGLSDNLEIDTSGRFRESAEENQEVIDKSFTIAEQVFNSLFGFNPYSSEQIQRLRQQNENEGSTTSRPLTGQGSDNNVDGGSFGDTLIRDFNNNLENIENPLFNISNITDMIYQKMNQRNNENNTETIIPSDNTGRNTDNNTTTNNENFIPSITMATMKETNRILEELIRETRRTREAIENQ